MRCWPEMSSFSAICVAALLAFGASTAAAQSASPAPSGSLSIAPLRVEMVATSEYAPMQLGNAMDRPVSIQVRIFSWHQEEGRDHYAPSTDLIASPSLFRVAPGATQDFRVIRQAVLAPGAEHRYRVVIDQLPEPVSSGGQAAATRLQLLVPLFANSETAAPARLEAVVDDGSVTVSNGGGRAARIDRLVLVSADGTQVPVPTDQVRYIHGASQVTYELEGFRCANGLVQRLTGQVDSADFDVQPASRCP